MAYTIAFFGTKPYDESSFNAKTKSSDMRYVIIKGI